LRIVSLASGSKGNCYYIETNETSLLVDCGLSLKQTESRLFSIGVDPNKIKYILVTHEHIDHTKGLEVFYNKYKPQIYCNYYSAEKIVNQFKKLDGKITTFDNEELFLKDIQVSPIVVSHDSVYCTAFKITKGKAQACILTDLGFVDNNILEFVSGSKVVYIESNHDEYMLKNCKYPAIVKSRIAGNNGHLSNRQAAFAILALRRLGTTHFVLSHISENSNTYEKAYITIAEILKENGIDIDKDVIIRFAHQHKPGNNFLLSEDK